MGLGMENGPTHVFHFAKSLQQSLGSSRPGAVPACEFSWLRRRCGTSHSACSERCAAYRSAPQAAQFPRQAVVLTLGPVALRVLRRGGGDDVLILRVHSPWPTLAPPIVRKW